MWKSGVRLLPLKAMEGLKSTVFLPTANKQKFTQWGGLLGMHCLFYKRKRNVESYTFVFH